MLKFTQTTNGAFSSFQYTGKAHPTGNRENWGEEGEEEDQRGPELTRVPPAPHPEEGGVSPENINDPSRSYTLLR